jgi:16S rRNA (cytosine1407-C5)-methyltransferase
MHSAHPFDRYAPFTDVDALKAFTDRPLRKSVRVNTLKMSVERFKQRASDVKWALEPVPFCKEAFFVDREDRGRGIGSDVYHLVGHLYIQEAASMLPVELLQPRPGDEVLDMSAAPGSKTTQIAAKMGGRGVIVANDVQEKRLWTLKSSLHRCGVGNVIVTKKVGQWFGKQMTERFDRVLCDAPCTAQGTARKDSDALTYCSLENIGKMARLQAQLLEAAVHAAKVGGTIVYSTCTLTPEENEGVVREILNKFSTQLEIVDPRTLDVAAEGYWDRALEDSAKVQAVQSPGMPALPLIRLWPQAYDTEGFFSAVIRKTAPTRDALRFDPVPTQERRLPKSRLKDAAEHLEKVYGTSFLYDGDALFERGEHLLVTPSEVANFDMPVEDYAIGLPFGKWLDQHRVLPSHEIAWLRGGRATRLVCEVDDAQMKNLLSAKDDVCDPSLKGYVIVRCGDCTLGLSLAKEGRLKNNLPRWMVAHGT